MSKEILYRKSTDGGKTFSDISNLSNSSSWDSNNLEISAAGNNVYAVWQDISSQMIDYQDLRDAGPANNENKDISMTQRNSRLLLRASNDGGNTFEDSIILSNNAFKSYPKISAFENSAYVAKNKYTIKIKTS